MQQINIMNMIKYQAQQSGQSIEEVQAQMGPWIQMQMQQMQQMHRMGASQYMVSAEYCFTTEALYRGFNKLAGLFSKVCRMQG